MVLKQPPYMPFYPKWEEVLLPILDYVEENLSAYVKMDKIAQYGKQSGFQNSLHVAGRNCIVAHSDGLSCLSDTSIEKTSDSSGFIIHHR